MRHFREFWRHVCVICSFACIFARVLDWYNPFMDFSGRIFFLQLMLYFGVIFLAVTGKQVDLRRRSAGHRK